MMHSRVRKKNVLLLFMFPPPHTHHPSKQTYFMTHNGILFEVVAFPKKFTIGMTVIKSSLTIFTFMQHMNQGFIITLF